MTTLELEGDRLEVAIALAKISRLGPVRSTGKGDMAVGKTLLDLLGIQQATARKPTFHGMALTARRNSGRAGSSNRVNLFAMVPDWKLSACKSSEEIAERYGYDRNGGRKLYVSVRCGRPNAQGLFLEVDRACGLLREKHLAEKGSADDVATWKLAVLQDRLLQRHPASAWITVNVTRREGQEYFHYRFIQFTDQPQVNRLADLLDQGMVTMDHLILSRDGRTVEKGPLFKIRPDNVRALFPESPRFDLMEM